MNSYSSRLIAALLALILLFVMSGCQAPADQNHTVTVTDQLGRQVEIPSEVKRIVSTYYISTSMVLALGAADKLVGIELKADTRPLYQLVAPDIVDLPAVGSAKALNIEAVLQLEPDLVILPVRMGEYVEQLEQLDLAVVVIDPEDLDSLAETCLLLGEAIGVPDRAQKIVDYYRGRVESIERLSSKMASKPRVYLAAGELLRTCTAQMYQHSIIELAGGKNVSGDIEMGYWSNVSMEQVLSWDPEIILLAEYSDAMPQELTKDKRWQEVTAVKNEQVFRFPSSVEPWDSPGPSAVLGILWLTNTLNPAGYSRAQLEDDVENFYRDYYGAEISAEVFGL